MPDARRREYSLSNGADCVGWMIELKPSREMRKGIYIPWTVVANAQLWWLERSIRRCTERPEGLGFGKLVPQSKDSSRLTAQMVDGSDGLGVNPYIELDRLRRRG